MKVLSILIVSLFLTSAQAADTAVSILKATSIDVTTPVPKCPQHAACEAVSSLVVTYTAQGCLDEVVVTASEDAELTPEGKRRINLSAVNIHNPKSKAAFCVRMPTKTINYTLGLGFITEENIQVVEATGILE